MSSLKERIKKLKSESGTHSPSINTLLRENPELNIKIDACFLSNPYATDLFMKEFSKIINTEEFRRILEFYPPQNFDIRRKIAAVLDANEKNIFVGNGAIEVIQACMHRFAGKKILLPIPTFSSYYEYILPNTQIEYYQLDEKTNFEINIDEYISKIKLSKTDTAIIINPNNPVGTYLSTNNILHFLEECKHLELIIIDESFIHFSYEDSSLDLVDNSKLVQLYPNLIIIKSMSKDFGIAGIRAGYGIMNENRVKQLLDNGYLWNISGIANYFFELYSDKKFQDQYEVIRKVYIEDTINFINNLNSISSIKVFPSKANFALIKLPNDTSSFDFCINLLINDGVYLRDCSDKIGLEGNFVRIASRSREENKIIVDSIKKYFE